MESQAPKASNYRPLVVLIGVIVAGAMALELAQPDFAAERLMRNVMGLFFLLFAMFKLFDVAGFAKGFQMYDLIARRSRVYALGYPYIELALGLFYLGNLWPVAANIVTLLLMLVGAAGVIGSIRSGMNLRCACLGTALNVPLSTVSLVENLAMAAMAALMLV